MASYIAVRNTHVVPNSKGFLRLSLTTERPLQSTWQLEAQALGPSLHITVLPHCLRIAAKQRLSHLPSTVASLSSFITSPSLDSLALPYGNAASMD